MRNNTAHELLHTKKCAKCLVEKPLSEFYSKGNRVSGRCKQCMKAYFRTRYVVAHEEQTADRLKRFIDVYFECEKLRLQQVLHSLNEIISRHKDSGNERKRVGKLARKSQI